VFPLLRLPFLFIVKVGAFKKQIKNYCGKIIRALSFYFIKIFINLLDSYINAQFKKRVAFVFKALLNLLENLIKEFYISN